MNVPELSEAQQSIASGDGKEVDRYVVKYNPNDSEEFREDLKMLLFDTSMRSAVDVLTDTEQRMKETGDKFDRMALRVFAFILSVVLVSLLVAYFCS